MQYLAAAIMVLGVIFSPGSNAAKTIYRCERNGQITLTDQPCEGSKPGRSNQQHNSIVEHSVDCRHLEWTASVFRNRSRRNDCRGAHGGTFDAGIHG
jgi:hypothetical protein